MLQICWPAHRIPVEIFELIIQHLAHDDMKSMRLANIEFEKKVSRSLFHTSVVPFNTELFDMIDDDTKTSARRARSVRRREERESKGQPLDVPTDKPPAPDSNNLSWQNDKEDKEGKVYTGHGLRVFKGFGPHIKRFGMSFEVSESQLHDAPSKKAMDEVDAYHGPYDWPPAQYTRFARLAGLERTADETSCMKVAFATLDAVHELALLVDSGLGWLAGPDKSVRARVFARPSRVFGSSRDVPNRTTQEAHEFWNALQQSRSPTDQLLNSKELTLAYKVLDGLPGDLSGLKGTQYCDASSWSSIDASRVAPVKRQSDLENCSFGVLYTVPVYGQLDTVTTDSVAGVTPNDLKKGQKEWLLETEWAQRAFLESYTLAVTDNAHIFGNVTTLNIPKLSSGFLSMIYREPFWKALPSLESITLHISPDWRSVAKDEAGYAETTLQDPSEAVDLFHDILKRRIALLPTVTRLNVGWTGGGEHGEGMFARNSNILPAPFTRIERSTAPNIVVDLKFEHVEHLTLTNCWITPPMLDSFIMVHANKALRKVTLDSVSLTAHPRFQGVGPAPVGAHMAQLQAQAIQAMQNGGLTVQQQVVFLAQMPGYQYINQIQHGGLFYNQQPAIQGAQLQAQLHQQLQQYIHLMQQHMNANPNNVPQVPLPNIANMINPTVPTHWSLNHREGSWPDLLDTFSPGPVFADYRAQPQPWEPQLPPRVTTSLQTIELISCGYAKLLRDAPFDQALLNGDYRFGHTDRSGWFHMRAQALKPYMMETKDKYLAQIVQHMPQRELDALQYAWNLRPGWQDAAKAEDAEWDGYLPGGTGRFSGVVEAGMPLNVEMLPEP